MKSKLFRKIVAAFLSIAVTLSCLVLQTTLVMAEPTITTLGSGIDKPNSVGVDSGGNIYFTVYTESRFHIQKMDANGENITRLHSLYTPFTDVAFDSSGNIYATMDGVGYIIKTDADGNYITQLGLGFFYPRGIAVDSSENIYVADTFNDAIKRMDSDGENMETLGSGFNKPHGIALDSSGNIYVADSSNDAIKRMDVNGENIEILGSGFDLPNGVAVDSEGYIYVADTGNNAVKRMDSSGGNIITLGSGFSWPKDIALDSSGNIYVADQNNNAIKKIKVDNPDRVTAEANTLEPAAGAENTITFTVKNVFDMTETSFNGSKNVTISGIQAAPNGTYGRFNEIELDVNSRTGQAISVAFTDGVASPTLRLNKAGTQTITFDIEGLSTPETNNLSITPTHETAGAMAITQNITAPSSNGGTFAQQPKVILKDTYGNICTGDSSTQVIASKKDTGSWTLTGTRTAAAINGVISFTDLAAVNGPQIEGAQIAFNATGLTEVTSTTVTLPISRIFTADSYTFDSSWGSEGSADGQFNKPNGIAMDTAGNAYVADSYNHQIQKFDSNGTFITKWGSEGSEDGKFHLPFGAAVDAAGNVYVVDTYNHQIQKFDSNGTLIMKWGSYGSGDGHLELPYGAVVDAVGNVYVADTSNHRIQKFDSEGNYVTKWGSRGKGEGEFDWPYGVALDGEGNVYVVDAGNRRIQKFDSNGTFITKWGSDGSANGQFIVPEKAAVDAAGNVYVTDTYNHQIQKFDSNGNFITKWGSNGGGDGQFNQPRGIAVDTEGNVYVADTLNHRIQKFVPNIPLQYAEGYPKADTFTIEGFTIKVKIDEAGTAYYIVLADGAAMPSVEQVKAGQDSTGADAVKRGNMTMEADTEKSVVVTGLSEGTEYDVYMVCEDSSGNTQYDTALYDVKTAISDGEALVRDKAALTEEIIRGSNSSVNNVTDDLNLITTGGNGTAISWSSSDEEYVTPSGEVNRPSYGEGDKEITLIATISKGEASDTKAFKVTVKTMLEDTHVATAEAYTLEPTVGVENTITLTVKNAFNMTDTSFDGSKNVTISGIEAAPNGTYGRFNEIELDVNSRTGQAISVAFTDGVASPDLRLNKAGMQTIAFSIEGLSTPETNNVSITPTHETVDFMAITQDITAPSSNGGTFAQQPKVTLKDTYGNICTSDSSTQVIASKKDTGNWTLTGTRTAAAINGVISFTDLGAVNNPEIQIDGAQIAFNSIGLTEVTSTTVTLSTASHTVSYNEGEHGTISSSSEFVVHNNSPAAIPTVTADTGYEFAYWSSDAGITKLSPEQLASQTITADITYTAYYNKSSTSKSSSTKSPEPENADAAVLVNGKPETIATETTSKEGEKTVVTITLDDKKVEEILQEEGSSITVTIPVNNDIDIVIGQLSGQMVKNMEEKEAVIQIKTENVTYTLPASEINIENIAQELGSQESLADIVINIQISEPQDDIIKIIEDTANENNFQMIVNPVEFVITATSGNKTVEVPEFNGYVEIIIALPDDIDPNIIGTAIVLNADGTFSPVPTTVVTIDGKHYVKISSLTNGIYSVIGNKIAFSDVENHWAKETINGMGSRLIISGVGDNRFEPNRDITRAEFTTIVVRALGIMRPGTGKDTFHDVSDTAWYYDAVSIAYEYGIISGQGNGEFRPMDKITREQAMTIIARAMEITKLESDLNTHEIEELLASFEDGEQSAAYAKNSIAACVKAGIVTGRSGNLLVPKGNITRAEVAVIVHRLLEKSELI